MLVALAAMEARAEELSQPASAPPGSPGSAAAEEREESSHGGTSFEIGVRGGYASGPIRGAVNPFGGGVGARVGLTFGHVYVGATVLYYLGGSDVGATDRALLFGGELGYAIPLLPTLTLRPSLGIGDAAVSHSEPVDVVTSASGASSVTTTVHSLYLEPGVTTLLSLGSFLVGLDTGLRVVPGITYGPAPAQTTTWLSYTLAGQIGLRF
jgi:hypothetical protein